ncbi:hypothetical protein [Aureibacillus halotolerans]|uniref:Uncharacterized protein n=1 Tax=Aureibacillus halotolerans TaxID=1508390 RepID=A0A4R6U2X0_9BACI|nr:hypothetical protein [Aureibacillus halotolerans]TDQ40710.1 hypothetical protein EV213_10556 [Aureibacillus halotolerans]
MAQSLRRKKVIIILTVMVLISSAIAYFYLEERVTFETVQANYEVFETPAPLEEASDFILTGTPVENENYLRTTREGYVEIAYTMTEFKLSEIKYQSPTVYNFEPGETITVIEPTYVYDNHFPLGKTRFSTGGYTLMEEGQEYLLFLDYNEEEDTYVMNGVTQGKYNFENDFDTNELRLSDHAQQQHEEFREYFIEQYR